MKSLISVLLLSTLLHANLFQEPDKQAHMTAAAVISLGTSVIAYDLGYTTTESYWIGVASGTLAGLLKELLDARSGGSGFDGRDLVADGIGASVGAIPVFMFEIKF